MYFLIPTNTCMLTEEELHDSVIDNPSIKFNRIEKNNAVFNVNLDNTSSHVQGIHKFKKQFPQSRFSMSSAKVVLDKGNFVVECPEERKFNIYTPLYVLGEDGIYHTNIPIVGKRLRIENGTVDPYVENVLAFASLKMNSIFLLENKIVTKNSVIDNISQIVYFNNIGLNAFCVVYKDSDGVLCMYDTVTKQINEVDVKERHMIVNVGTDFGIAHLEGKFWVDAKLTWLDYNSEFIFHMDAQDNVQVFTLKDITFVMGFTFDADLSDYEIKKVEMSRDFRYYVYYENPDGNSRVYVFKNNAQLRTKLDGIEFNQLDESWSEYTEKRKEKFLYKKDEDIYTVNTLTVSTDPIDYVERLAKIIPFDVGDLHIGLAMEYSNIAIHYEFPENPEQELYNFRISRVNSFGEMFDSKDFIDDDTDMSWCELNVDYVKDAIERSIIVIEHFSNRGLLDGLLTIGIRGTYLYIDTICVNSKSKVNEIGTSLIFYTQNLSQQLQTSGVILEAIPNVVTFYRKLGFIMQVGVNEFNMTIGVFYNENMQFKKYLSKGNVVEIDTEYSLFGEDSKVDDLYIKKNEDDDIIIFRYTKNLKIGNADGAKDGKVFLTQAKDKDDEVIENVFNIGNEKQITVNNNYYNYGWVNTARVVNNEVFNDAVIPIHKTHSYSPNHSIVKNDTKYFINNGKEFIVIDESWNISIINTNVELPIDSFGVSNNASGNLSDMWYCTIDGKYYEENKKRLRRNQISNLIKDNKKSKPFRGKTREYFKSIGITSK